MKKILQIEPWISSSEAKYLNHVIKNNYLTENKYTKNFEDNFKKFLCIDNLISVNNWTMGLFACLKVCNIGPGDNVIVPNITFIATANSVLLTGAKVKLCEINTENYCIDFNKAESLIDRNTKAIIPVHLYGNACDMKKAMELKKKYGIQIIEDAAQSLGGKYNNKNLGTIGDFGGYSLYGNKIITTGEGGIIVSNSKKNINKIKILKNHGRKKKGSFRHDEVGFNFCMTEMQSAIGIAQLKKLNKIISKKEKIFNAYFSRLNQNNNIQFINYSDDICKPVYWFTTVICNQRKKLEDYLNKNHIQTRRIFYPLHNQPCYKKNKSILNRSYNFKESNNLYKMGLSLPSSYNLTIKEINYICKKIIFFYENRS